MIYQVSYSYHRSHLRTFLFVNWSCLFRWLASLFLTLLRWSPEMWAQVYPYKDPAPSIFQKCEPNPQIIHASNSMWENPHKTGHISNLQIYTQPACLFPLQLVQSPGHEVVKALLGRGTGRQQRQQGGWRATAPTRGVEGTEQMLVYTKPHNTTQESINSFSF